MCVNSLLLFWQEKSHKILHESKMNFSRTLSNLEKFWFSRKIRIWGLHSPRSGLEWEQLWWENYSVRLHKGLFCRIRFSTAMTKAAQSVPWSVPSAPTALRWLSAHAATHTMPGNCSGSTESCGTELHQWQPEPFQRRSSWSRRGNHRWGAVSDSAFCRTTSESLSVPAYLLVL